MKKTTRRILIVIAVILVFTLSDIKSTKTTPAASIKAYYSDATILETIWVADDYPLCVFVSNDITTSREGPAVCMARFKSYEVFGTTYWKRGVVGLSSMKTISSNDRLYYPSYGNFDRAGEIPPINAQELFRIDNDIYFMYGVTQRTNVELYRINGIEPTVIYTELDGEAVTFWYVVGDSRLNSSATTEIEYLGE